MSQGIELYNLEVLGKCLRDQRKKMGVTQEQAAQLCNVGPRFINELEKGKPTASISKVLQVIRGYGFRLILKNQNLETLQ